MRIAITGIGIVSALGVGAKVNKEKLLAGESGVAAPRILDTVHKEWPVGEVPLTTEQLRQYCELPSDSPYPRNLLLAIPAVGEALEDAGLSKEQKAEMILINGTTVGGMDVTENEVGKWFQGDTATIDKILFHEAGATGFMLRQVFGLNVGLTISTACSSALNAIMYGADMLRIGAAKRILVGGTEALTRFHLNGFGSLGILSEQVCRPFQPDRDGINLGEGAAYLVLETEEEAIARSAKIYGYVSGYGNRCDAFHQTASSPEGEGAYLAMQEALRMSGLKPTDIQYINAHGTATQNNDASEAKAIERVFGTPFEAPRWPEPRSTKNLTGHTTSASGSIEAAFSLMLMQERGYEHVMTNAFAFGGNDSSLILSAKPTDVPEMQMCKGTIGPEMEVDQDMPMGHFLKPMESRRLNKQMRRLVVAAKSALESAGIDKPDAIIVGTRWGGMQPTMELLKSMVENGEKDFSPTLFMQSTHNTAATTLARLLGSHGYNITLSIHNLSFDFARAFAFVQLNASDLRNVLVCGYDEEVPEWQQLLEKVEDNSPAMTKAYILKKE